MHWEVGTRDIFCGFLFLLILLFWLFWCLCYSNMEPAKNTISRLISISFGNPTIFSQSLWMQIKNNLCVHFCFKFLDIKRSFDLSQDCHWVKRFRLLCFEVNSFSHREMHQSTEKENPISKYLIISVRWILCQISFESNSCSICTFRIKSFQVLGGKNELLLIIIHCNALKLITQNSDWGCQRRCKQPFIP